MAVQLTEHQRKFDRQTRLWGGHGQELIETCKVCVLGSGPTATETLKNLVLPNIGNFVIVDNAKVGMSDCGNNFFVTQDNIGDPRAKITCGLLLEMNPDVKGDFLCKDYNEIIEKELNYFDKFNLVIATQLYGENHIKLGKYLYDKNIPYLNVRSNGLLGYIRTCYKEITVMESHPTNDRTDLYIYPDQLKNFEELQKYIDSYNIYTEDMHEKTHIPCIAFLGQYTKEWLKSHEKLPSSFKEQNEFKDNLRKQFGQDENIDEAIAWAYQCYNKPRIDREVQQVLNDASGEKLNEKSSDFWILIRSLRDFMENEGAGFLPVSTNIPDIHTSSKSYVTLKKIYQQRFEKDLKAITSYAHKHLKKLNRDEKSIPNDIIERFVKNVRALKVVRTKSIDDEFDKPDMEKLGEAYIDLAALEEGAANGDEKNDDEEEKLFNPKNINWYWVFRACDMFYDEYNRLPGSVDNENALKKDIEELQKLLKDYFKKIDFDQDIIKECLEEVVRFGGEEIHNTAAMMGGIAAQAALKITLQQFFTFSHTFIWNGIFCSGEVFDF